MLAGRARRVTLKVYERKERVRLAEVAALGEGDLDRMLLYSLIVVWFAHHGHRHWQAPDRPWCRSKRGPAFVDMLDTLRSETLRTRIISLGLRGPGSRKIIHTLQQVTSLAA
jgi:hypothetical protein